MLNLIDDGAVVILSQESSGIGLGEIALVQRFQIRVIQVAEGSPAEGRFAGLARPRHCDKGVCRNRAVSRGVISRSIMRAPFQRVCPYCKQYLQYGHLQVGKCWR